MSLLAGEMPEDHTMAIARARPWLVRVDAFKAGEPVLHLGDTDGHVGLQFELLCDGLTPVTWFMDHVGRRWMVRHMHLKHLQVSDTDLAIDVSRTLLEVTGLHFAQYCVVVDAQAVAPCVWRATPAEVKPSRSDADKASEEHRMQIRQLREAWHKLTSGAFDVLRVGLANGLKGLPTVDQLQAELGAVFAKAATPRSTSGA